MSKKNKMSFDIDLNDTENSLREQVEEQLENNGYTEDDMSDEDFSQSMDEIYGQSSDEDEEDDQSDDDLDSATKKKDDAVKEQTSTEDNQEQRKEFGDRANKRIRELNAQKKQAFEEAEQARKEKFETEKNALATRKELLNFKIEKLKHDFESAINDGDASKQVEINAELARIGADISRIESQEEQYKEYKPTTKERSQATEEDVFGVGFDQDKAGKLASDWEFDNPRVLTDKTFADTSVKIGQQLMQRGFQPDTEKFYSELTRRVNMAFGINNPQQSNDESVDEQTNKQTDGAKVVVAKKNPPQKVQTVAGASRTPAPTTMSGASNNKNSIRLEKDDINIAKQLGVDLKTYATNKSRVEKSMNEKGQVRIELFPDY